MARSDLLALTPDDLAALTNRGTVKRAQRELDSGDPDCEIDETGEQLVVKWSDGIICRFLAGKTIHDATCSSGSVGISRHTVRSVLAYQLYAQSEPETEQSSEDPTSETSATVWNPGKFTDDDLTRQFRKAAVTRARKVFEEGVLVELTGGAKPVARFLHESCTVRFPVPGDLRYATADCAESLLPLWVPLAVWSFREFASDRVAGLLSIQQAELPTPHDDLRRLDSLLAELCSDGLASVSATWPQRMARLEKQLRSSGIVWPAEIVADLLHQHQRYHEHDARFEPQEVVRLIGELIARTRAIRSQNGSVPQPLIRGTKSDRRTDIKGGRFVGVGMGVRPGRHHTTMHAYLQDADTGTVVAIERTFNDPDPDSGDVPKPFAELANHGLARGVSLGGVSLSQLLLGSGKRTPTGELVLPRGTGKLTTNPQTFQWEQLKPPFAVENFAQLRQRFESLPPEWLRPRRHTENLHVVAVTGAGDAEFDVVNQQLAATLHDANGDTAMLIHPFHSRGLEGFNDLDTVVDTRGEHIRFVCGHVRLSGREICIHPISVVFDDGDSRIAINPGLANRLVLPSAGSDGPQTPELTSSPISDFLAHLRRGLAETLLTGLQQANPNDWTDLLQAGRHVGFVRLVDPIEKLAGELSNRSNTLRWDSTVSTNLTAQLCMLTRMLQ